MAPRWSLLPAKKGSFSKDTSAVSVHAFSAAARRKSEEIKGEGREKPRGGKGWWVWRRRRRPPLPLPPRHLHNNQNSSALFALALVFFSLGALLVAGLASKSKAAASAEIASYAPPRNWTSPPAAVRVVDGDTVVAAGIVVRLLGMDAPEDGQLCGRKRRGRILPLWGEKDKKNNFFFSSRARGRRGATEEASSPSSPSSFFSRWLLLLTLPSKPRQAPPQQANRYDCGTEATRALRCLVAGKSLRCERKGTDRFGRALARCFVDETQSLFSVIPFLRDSGSASGGPIDVGEWMLRRGHAVSYLGFTTKYLEAESAAKREQRGIWGGEFELPEMWRSKRRKEREARAKEKKRKKERTDVSAKKHEKAKAKGSSNSGRNKKKKRSK